MKLGNCHGVGAGACGSIKPLGFKWKRVAHNESCRTVRFEFGKVNLELGDAITYFKNRPESGKIAFSQE